MTELFSQCARLGARCDYALYAGAGSDNAKKIAELAHLTAGLKMYLNDTYSTLKMPDLTQWMAVSALDIFSFSLLSPQMCYM